MLSKRIVKIMKTKSLSVEEVAKRSGMSQSTLTKLITGETKNPTLSTLTRLAEGIGISLSELFEEKFPTYESKNPMRFYTKSGECVVLISEYYGVGWGTENGTRLATDKRIIAKLLRDHPTKREMKRFLKKIGYKHINMAAYHALTFAYIPKGSRFKIISNNGMEEVIVEGKGNGWLIA